ncbi:uncharacterized protein IUM83_09586 [Phytophthora cinnamomi]|uniref:uncharacterized protein n=1 Tax=Phytophthora cinnamomi TaxID=4785 RepID=UPI0035598BC5|nr:hypothetical protein IUM83_09586 [Phytophthora cinnamomi]
MEDSSAMDVDVEVPAPAAELPVDISDGDASQQFAELYMSKLLAKLREGNQTPQAAAIKLQAALLKLHELQQEFVAKQAKQNLLDRLAQVETLEALQRAAASRKAQTEACYDQEMRELQTAVQERQETLRLLERMADEVEQEKRNVVEHERSRGAHESELAQLNEVWKEIQRRNARRKAAVQVATGVMITDEDDCSRVLDQQTQSIQEMHQKQKLLEDEKIDISTQVKRTKRTIENLSRQNDLRSKDAEVKQREQDYMTLQQMKHWYDHVRSIQESLSGMEITKVADDYLERVQFLTPDVAATDLAEIAVRDNNVQYLLCEYRERVRAHLAL